MGKAMGLRIYALIAILAGIFGFIGNIWMFFTYTPPIMVGEPLFFRYADIIMYLLFCIAGFGVLELKGNSRKLAIFIAWIALVESFLKVISAVIIPHSLDPACIRPAILFLLPLVIFNIVYLIYFNNPSVKAVFAGSVEEKKKLLKDTGGLNLTGIAVIETKEDAIKAINKISIIISIVVAITILVSVFVLKVHYLAAILAALIWGIPIFLFKRYRSIIAALAMELLSGLLIFGSSKVGIISL